jgi:hypothetical protein
MMMIDTFPKIVATMTDLPANAGTIREDTRVKQRSEGGGCLAVAAHAMRP